MAMITLPIASLCTIASTLAHHTGGWYGVCSINNKYYAGAIIYIRAVNIQRDGEQYGTYYQAVRSYREQGKVKQEVIHLGQHSTADEALKAWEREIGALEATRPKRVKKLQAKLERLQKLTHTD
jgi:hypothetical protein